MKPRPWDQTHPENIFKRFGNSDLNAIEKRVSAIETFLREKFELEFEIFCAEHDKPAPEVKRGPKPAISDDHLFINRDRFIDFFESYWPELREVFKKAKRNPTFAKLALEKIGDPCNGHQAPTARKLLRSFETLIHVLKSSEYSGDPRFIANAMAGVPAIAWVTSLKRCRAQKSKNAIGERALLDYVQRNFRPVYLRVINASTAEEKQRIMQTQRTTDKEFIWLRDQPEALKRAIEAGKPRQINGDPKQCAKALVQDEVVSPRL